jgi:hypothetical protein
MRITTLLTIALLAGCGDGIISDRDYWHPACEIHADCGPGGLCLYKDDPSDARCFQECASNVECVEPYATCRPLSFVQQFCDPFYPVWPEEKPDFTHTEDGCDDADPFCADVSAPDMAVPDAGPTCPEHPGRGHARGHRD